MGSQKHHFQGCRSFVILFNLTGLGSSDFLLEGFWEPWVKEFKNYQNVMISCEYAIKLVIFDEWSPWE
jgi:hypothetical protein